MKYMINFIVNISRNNYIWYIFRKHMHMQVYSVQLLNDLTNFK